MTFQYFYVSFFYIILEFALHFNTNDQSVMDILCASRQLQSWSAVRKTLRRSWILLLRMWYVYHQDIIFFL